MASRRTPIVVAFFGLVGCGEIPSPADFPPVIGRSPHDHEHLHGPDLHHDHVHRDFPAGRHAHAHRHAPRDEPVGAASPTLEVVP